MDMKRYIILLTMLLAASFAWAQGDEVTAVEGVAAVEDVAAVEATEPTRTALSLDALWGRANDYYAAGEYDVALADYEACLSVAERGSDFLEHFLPVELLAY